MEPAHSFDVPNRLTEKFEKFRELVAGNHLGSTMNVIRRQADSLLYEANLMGSSE